ncbi:CAZyme family AA1 [Trichoderma aggressivum f. europaeum]|uniref:CAZyme family AA1 n=1 Tax=Trichoderma aggressivum f. europaeum TaxID=173218 RepID=A0AAE1II34_9HYPO|nr:CAZyme family AA1 [Trichoderma aggressivum f. europaeum]
MDAVGAHQRGDSTGAFDDEARQELGEEQPFIRQSHRSSSGFRPSRRQHRSLPAWKLGLFFFIVTVSVLALAAVPFGLQSLSRESPSDSAHEVDGDDHSPGDHSGEDEADHHEEESEPAAGDGDKSSSEPLIVHHEEEMPSMPKLRNVSEYVLSPSWDFDAAPTTREYHWTIVDGRLNPDGIYRPMILINNQFPGPLVECNQGDTIRVIVENKAINATSMHFHGLFQNGTNSMDGAVGITQCPIAPSSTFTYEFQIKDQSGTYWYHAHHSAQASDGLLGPVVIHSKDERTTLQKLKYASDRIIMVQDHYHNLTSELLMGYLKNDMENNEPVPDNGLINGRGVRDCKDFQGWDCDTADVSIPTFNLTAGQRHRLRIINVGAFAEFQIQFDEHPFYVTEVDGTDVFPEPFHRLNILPAQRYSIILETNVTTTDAFWMRARMVTHCFTTKNHHLQPEMRAVIRYDSPESKTLDKEPTSKDWPEAIEVICRDLNVSALHPVIPMTPPPADKYMRFDASFMIGDWRLARGFFNQSTWHHNVTRPSLHRFLGASSNATSLKSPIGVNNMAFDYKKELVIQTEGIRTVDLAINNFDDGNHPFHLHGHKFFVLYQGRGGYPPYEADFPDFVRAHNLDDNPVRRDTVTVEGYSWAVIRLVLDNPGMWAFHCHNMWHAESGMVMQFLVRSDVVRGWTVSDQAKAMCGLEGVTTGMRADDNIWFGNFGKK